MTPRPAAAGAAIPLTVVAGLAGPAKRALLGHWLAGRPPGERWALVLAESPPPAEADVAVLDLRGACVCCTAVPVLTARLPALLRGRPARLVIEAGETADPAALRARLAGEPWSRWLEPARVIVAIDGGRLAPHLDDPGRPAAERLFAGRHLDAADRLWVDGDPDAGALARLRTRAPVTVGGDWPSP